MPDQNSRVGTERWFSGTRGREKGLLFKPEDPSSLAGSHIKVKENQLYEVVF